MVESWSGPLEQRLDRLVNTGRQLVNGVYGGRPGARGGERRLRGPNGLGRWVENKLDWILDEGDEPREPWRDPQPALKRRRPLEAISRRSGQPDQAARSEPAPGEPEPWPDDDAFVVPRWQRQAPAAAQPDPPASVRPGSFGRAMPRSTRRRLAG